MKCARCGSDNRREAKFCGECGTPLTVKQPAAPVKPVKAAVAPLPRKITEGPALWCPDWRWHLKTLTAIYVVLIVAYFAISHFLSTVKEPFRMRDIPQEMTPWLKK